MNIKIKKVAVLGSGVMGSAIACHLANVGLDVLLLDIVPFDLPDDKKNDKIWRNSIVNNALKSAINSKPAPLYSNNFSHRITTGNFSDDFEKIKDADWIIEVVIEKLDIKKDILEKVEQFKSSTAIVTTNTSSIPIAMLTQERSLEFAKLFCGTHFFNPPRYMPLLEIIPHEDTNPEVIDFFINFGNKILGKTTVLCRDTPAFIANRIGVMSTIKTYQLTEKYEMSIEEVDAITGELIGRPKTATFKLQDLVGIDTGDKVASFVTSNVTNDTFFDKLKDEKTPSYIEFLLDNKFLGRKTNKGFYEKTKAKDSKGKSIINALNLNTLQYAPAKKPYLAAIKESKSISIFSKRLITLINGEHRENKFLREYFADLFAYSAARIPEISNEFYRLDDAMKAGYMWDYGPFEYWDLIGLHQGIELIKEFDHEVPVWINKIIDENYESFYAIKNEKRVCYSLSNNTMISVPSAESFVQLNLLNKSRKLISNSEANVYDLDDGVMCVEFVSKGNALGEGTGQAINSAIQKAEEEGWNGIVIGNNSKNFTVGANLMSVGMFAMQKDFDKLDNLVRGFQNLTMNLRTSKIPVVLAGQGYVFGGGCEMAMHANECVFAAESYIGLVEVGVGLLPGGGGTKEMAVRASDKFYQGDTQIPMLIEHFKPIATAQVATSAYQAFDNHLLLKTKDHILHNNRGNILRAKEQVLNMVEEYIAPSWRNDIIALGRTGLSALYTAINEFRLGGYMSDYDVEIARKVAYVICGGDLTGTQKVSEQYLLDLEREAFLSLLGNQKTLDRIQYMLLNSKPLRN